MASSQYNSVYDMYKNNTAKPQTLGEPPVYDEPDPNAPIYSMYGNNQFGNPVLPDQKPAFNSVYDIYGQGKMNDFSAGAGKTPTSPLDKPNANPLVGNKAKAPDESNPYIPPAPSAPEESGVDDSEYTPGAAPGVPSENIGPEPTPPGEPPPLDKEGDTPPPPAPPGGGGGGGGGGGSGEGASDAFGFADAAKKMGGGDGTALNRALEADAEAKRQFDEKMRLEYEKLKQNKPFDPNELLQRLLAEIDAKGTRMGGVNGGAAKEPPKPAATPTHTTWNGKNWIIHYSDGSSKVSNPFANTKGTPAAPAPAPANKWEGIGPGPGAGAGWSK